MPEERFTWRACEEALRSDWMEKYKIYGPGLANKRGEMCGKRDSGRLDAKDRFSNVDTFKTEDAQLCKTLDQYMQDNSGQV